MQVMIDYLLTPVEYCAVFVVGLTALCAGGVAMLFVMGTTWATGDWLVCVIYCTLRRRRPPSWHSRFMALSNTGDGNGGG